MVVKQSKAAVTAIAAASVQLLLGVAHRNVLVLSSPWMRLRIPGRYKASSDRTAVDRFRLDGLRHSIFPFYSSPLPVELLRY